MFSYIFVRLFSFLLGANIDLTSLLTSLEYTRACVAAVHVALSIPAVREHNADCEVCADADIHAAL